MEASVNGTQRKAIGVDAVFSASEAAGLTRQVVEERSKASTRTPVTFGTAALDDYLIPCWPGDLVMVCGRPQNFKTGYIQTVLHQTTAQIIAENATNECTVMVTWEVSVEQAMAYWLAVESGISATDMMRGEMVGQWDKFDLAVMKVSSKPIYIIGHSTKRSEDNRRRRPNLTTDNVTLALDYLMNDLNLEPRMVALDYLQRIHMAGNITRNEHYLQAVDWAKDTALWGGCPVFLGTQARREVDDYKIKLPGLRDSQWSSNAEQSADKFFSLWMPKQSHDTGEHIHIGGDLGEIEVSERLLLFGATKQKFGPAGKIFPLYVEPEYLKLGDYARA